LDDFDDKNDDVRGDDFEDEAIWHNKGFR
jgi:hypothetical protein